MKFINHLAVICFCCIASLTYAQKDKPLRLGIAGLSHAHVWEVISRLDRGDFVVVGIAEKDTVLWRKKALTDKVISDLFFTDLEKMLDKTKPEAVIVYENIYDHLRIVEACAARGIHIMVEKPMAVSVDHAEKMISAAQKANVLLLTNYETTWYPANHKAFDLVQENATGKLSRINVYDGHQGPIEIGCGKEFTNWLADPVLNGGGAVTDFGCYGANLCTWLMNGQMPLTVFAHLKQLKPQIYPNVDDDATIILEYPNATAVIMASWNWPMSRKDMHIYGNKGYIYQDNQTDIRVYTDEKENKIKAEELLPPYNDPFLYLKAAVRKQISVKPTDLSSPENNLIVVKILEAAKKSSKKRMPIKL